MNFDSDSEDEEIWGPKLSRDEEPSQITRNIQDSVACLLRLSVALRNPAATDRVEAEAGENAAPSTVWDKRHLCEKYPNLDPKLRERLGRALTRRREYFKYRENHHELLSKGIDNAMAGVAIADNSTKAGPTTVASLVPECLKAITSVKPDFSDLSSLPIDEAQSEGSCTSYATSAANPGKLKVPKVPEGYEKGPVLCPFCRKTIAIRSRKDWN